MAPFQSLFYVNVSPIRNLDFCFLFLEKLPVFLIHILYEATPVEPVHCLKISFNSLRGNKALNLCVCVCLCSCLESQQPQSPTCSSSSQQKTAGCQVGWGGCTCLTSSITSGHRVKMLLCINCFANLFRSAISSFFSECLSLLVHQMAPSCSAAPLTLRSRGSSGKRWGACSDRCVLNINEQVCDRSTIFLCYIKGKSVLKKTCFQAILLF